MDDGHQVKEFGLWGQWYTKMVPSVTKQPDLTPNKPPIYP